MIVRCGICEINSVTISMSDLGEWSRAIEKTVGEVGEMVESGLLLFACEECQSVKHFDDEPERAEMLATMVERILGGEPERG